MDYLTNVSQRHPNSEHFKEYFSRIFWTHNVDFKVETQDHQNLFLKDIFKGYTAEMIGIYLRIFLRIILDFSKNSFSITTWIF